MSAMREEPYSDSALPLRKDVLGVRDAEQVRALEQRPDCAGLKADARGHDVHRVVARLRIVDVGHDPVPDPVELDLVGSLRR